MLVLRWAFVLGAIIILQATGSATYAQTGANREARFEGTAAVAREGADNTVSIDILRWSTAEEIEEMTSLVTDGVEGIAEHLGDASTLGYLWTAESVGYSIRYATTAPMAGGGDRIVLALNDRFGTRNPTLWESELDGDAPFTVIELRIPGGGAGEGRNVLPTTTAYAFGIDGYVMSQVLLENVERAD